MQDDSLEIDRHQLVIRCNDVGKEGSSCAPYKGSRCDVSYYNKERVRSLAADSSLTFREDVRWLSPKAVARFDYCGKQPPESESDRPEPMTAQPRDYGLRESTPQFCFMVL